MSDHKHGEMDTKVQVDTFDGFMRFTTWSVVAILVLVVLMAMFIT
ncbi:MAG: aa3-type cytochrome c oxidase subunit IV [Sedimentitalea sp.]